MRFMSKAAVAIATMGLAAGSVIGAGAANAASLHGAIAFSGDDWSYGTSIDAPSREEAIAEALDACGIADCIVLVDWADGCGALVYTDDAVATGAGFNRSAALFGAYASMSRHYPPAFLANVGSADRSGTEISEVICTANAG
ncbi:DUF4189 domain-containing protein [Nocardia suismassiliense]|uniref:DUF4189 domain-containing protein n=1 Tax=Nocardia suismassiliense TaxID=2077092 RepID=UPI000D1FC7D7|nr:DUF4189 domain-containing protein [Nocardia suismassiliense]